MTHAHTGILFIEADPPTRADVRIALAAINLGLVRRVGVVVAAEPFSIRQATPSWHRLLMAKALFADMLDIRVWMATVTTPAQALVLAAGVGPVCLLGSVDHLHRLAATFGNDDLLDFRKACVPWPDGISGAGQEAIADVRRTGTSPLLPKAVSDHIHLHGLYGIQHPQAA